MLTRLSPVDVIVAVGATGTWLALVEVENLGATLLVATGLFLVHQIAWAAQLWRLRAPLEVWEREGEQCSDEQLLAADRAAEVLTPRLTAVYTLTWLVFFGGLPLIAYLVPGLIVMGQAELVSAGFQIAAATMGGQALVYPLVRYLIEDTQAGLGVELTRRGLIRARASIRMRPRLAGLALCLTLAPLLWYFGMNYLTLAAGAREVARVEQRDIVRRSAARVREGGAPIDAGHELVTADELPPALAGPEHEGEALRVFVELRVERVHAAAAVGDGRWVLARAPVGADTSSFWFGLAAFIIAVAAWAGLVISATMGALFGPLARLHAVVRRAVERGDLREIGRIPVSRSDEVGALTVEVNHMLARLVELADAASAVAAGDLRVDISGRGDLQDAFRAMLARLEQLVVEIREAGLGLASAAAEIHAATSAQEAASGQQSEGVREVSVTVQVLAESAASISVAAGEVLGNAERTRSHADQVSERLAELSRHMAGVGELLELIREVADRSDLLALNGSLEATRAGEAGRGFGLVAAEMRRLAERVTGTVDDLRGFASDIEASSASTLSATRDSRVLAERTTEAAEEIVELTDQQRSETEQVSGNAEQIADLVARAAATTSQTRATADGLRDQARALEALIARFRIRDEAHETHET